MAIIGRRLRAGLAVTATAFLLGGCADGVEVNSRLLDSVGLSTAALTGSKPEPKLQPRAPLVMPPSTQRLPEPGSAPPPQPGELAANAAWPKDKDQERIAQAKDKDRQQAEYCRDGNWKERAIDHDSGGMQGPQGQCGSIFSVIGGIMSGGAQKLDPMEGGIR
jgi:hypothetical protein